MSDKLTTVEKVFYAGYEKGVQDTRKDFVKQFINIQKSMFDSIDWNKIKDELKTNKYEV